MQPIDIVYPYLHSKAKFEELKYSIRSIEQYFVGKYRVVIIGDVLPNWLDESKVLFIEHQRNEMADFTVATDANTKMDIIINHPDISDEFVVMYDDIYLLNGIDKELMRRLSYSIYIAQIIQGEPYFHPQSTSSANYKHTQTYTYDALFAAGFADVYNFETHIPRVVSKKIMKEVFALYKPIENHLQRFTLYYNYLVSETALKAMPKFIYTKEIGIKAGFYGVDTPHSFANDKETIETACKLNYYLNHNDLGLSDGLRKYIEQRFTIPSNYEKGSD